MGILGQRVAYDSKRAVLRGEWDSDRIAQVLSNLIRNAIQHAGASDPIDLAAEDHGDEVWLLVHNGGPAIPERAQATMFEPMVRHVEGDSRSSGIGLGLYIALQVVLSHGGTLSVVSTDSAGTTFTGRQPRRALFQASDSAPPMPGAVDGAAE